MNVYNTMYIHTVEDYIYVYTVHTVYYTFLYIHILAYISHHGSATHNLRKHLDMTSTSHTIFQVCLMQLRRIKKPKATKTKNALVARHIFLTLGQQPYTVDSPDGSSSLAKTRACQFASAQKASQRPADAQSPVRVECSLFVPDHARC